MNMTKNQGIDNFILNEIIIKNNNNGNILQ